MLGYIMLVAQGGGCRVGACLGSGGHCGGPLVDRDNVGGGDNVGGVDVVRRRSIQTCIITFTTLTM